LAQKEEEEEEEERKAVSLKRKAVSPKKGKKE